MSLEKSDAQLLCEAIDRLHETSERQARIVDKLLNTLKSTKTVKLKPETNSYIKLHPCIRVKMAY